MFKEEVSLADESISIEKITNDFDNHIRATWDREDIKGKLQDYDGYALVYLNEYLFARESDAEFKLGDKYDIEHIMPYSGKNISEIRRDCNCLFYLPTFYFNNFTVISNRLSNII